MSSASSACVSAMKFRRPADRAANADRFQASFNLGPRRGREEHARGSERDDREGHEQVDHDPGRLVEEDLDSRARHKAESFDAEARGPRLHQDLV